VARKRTYTIAEAADLVGVSRKALARRVERGSLQSVKRNGRRLIPRSELVRAGLLPEEGDERGVNVDVTGLPAPIATTQGESETALVGLVRELLERLERQANELAQFRALTVQAESLRAGREVDELRARLASLENRSREAEHHLAPAETIGRGPGPIPGGRASRSTPIWLPPSAAAPPAGTAAASARPPMAERPPTTPAATGWNRWWLVFLVEAAFIAGVAVLAASAQLRPLAVVGVVGLAWALVAVADGLAWLQRRKGSTRGLGER
jgi:excisionase family DNA binding protein